MVEQLGLQSNLVRLHVFRRDGQLDIAGRERPRIVAPGGEAGRIGRIGQDLGRELVLDGHARIEARDGGRRRVRHDGRQPVQRFVVVVVLALGRIAHARRQQQLVRQMDLGVAVAGHILHRRAVVDLGEEEVLELAEPWDVEAEAFVIDLRPVDAPGGQVEGAQGPLDAPVPEISEEARFFAELVVTDGVVDQLGGNGDVALADAELAGEQAIGHDVLEVDAVRQVYVQDVGQAVGLHRIDVRVLRGVALAGEAGLLPDRRRGVRIVRPERGDQGPIRGQAVGADALVRQPKGQTIGCSGRDSESPWQRGILGGRDGELGVRRGLGLVVGEVGGEVVLDLVVQDPADLRLGLVAIDAAQRAVAAVPLRGQAEGRQLAGQARIFAGEVLELHIAVAPLLAGRQADHQLVRDGRPVERALDVETAVVPGGRLDIAAVGVVRLLGEDPDRPTHGVAPVQDTLRPALDLDPVHVEQVKDRSEGGRVIDVIDVEADPWLEGEAEVRLAYAADEGEIRRAEAPASLGQGHVRGRLGDVQDIAVAAVLDLGGVHRGDRDRRLLKVLRPELRGDHHLLQHRAGRLRRRRGCPVGGPCGLLGHGEARNADGGRGQHAGQGDSDGGHGGLRPQPTAAAGRFELLIAHSFPSPVTPRRRACGRRPARPGRGLLCLTPGEFPSTRPIARGSARLERPLRTFPARRFLWAGFLGARRYCQGP